jgi:ABC-type branched-subunit amino acid transport system substrate-binding protein
VGVVTGWSNELAGASLPVYRENGLAVVVPWVVSPDLADAEAGIVLAAADGEQVALGLARQTSALDVKNVILVGDLDSATGTLALQSVNSNLVFLAAPSGVVDPAGTVVRDVLNWPAQSSLLVLGLDSVPAGEILLALDEAGWHTPVLGTAGAGNVHLVNVAGHAADGLLFASPAPNGRDVNVAPPSPETPLDELGPRAVMAYDATRVLLDAIERSIELDGQPTRRGVIDVLPGLRVSGLTGEVVINDQARRANAPVWFYRITGGQYPGEMVAAAAD